MVEEEKKENLEFVEQGKQPPSAPPPPPPLPKSAVAAVPTPFTPPRRKYQRRNKFNIPTIESEAKTPDPNAVWTHERHCGCGAGIRFELSRFPAGTSGADWEMRNAALSSGWDVRLLISGHLLFTCPRCLLKVA